MKHRRTLGITPAARTKLWTMKPIPTPPATSLPLTLLATTATIRLPPLPTLSPPPVLPTFPPFQRHYLFPPPPSLLAANKQANDPSHRPAYPSSLHPLHCPAPGCDKTFSSTLTLNEHRQIHQFPRVRHYSCGIAVTSTSTRGICRGIEGRSTVCLGLQPKQQQLEW